MYDFLVVGAGFSGSVLAERLASQLGKKVLLIDRRSHVGGNAHDFYNEHGILVHRYGPHIFHTNNVHVFEYLSQFTKWRSYQYRARALVEGKFVPIPINRETVNTVFGTAFQSDGEVEAFLETEREKRPEILNSEDYVLARAGRRLYTLLYEGYTMKQWGLPPRELAASVCGRIPVRLNLDDRYFDDVYQGIPLEGYTALFQKMLDHKNIELLLETDMRRIEGERFDRLIYTGAIDEFFSYTHGKLPYRSLRFEYETLDRDFVQPVASIHYPNDYAYTRTTEYKHLTGQHHSQTTIAKEFPRADGDPYYPIPCRESNLMYERYRKESLGLRAVTFAGRLGSYQYYNMDQVVAQSLAAFERLSAKDAHG